MEKRQRRGLIASLFSSSWHLPGNLAPFVARSARRSRTTERSESVSEEASYLYHIFCLRAGAAFSPAT
jgi:hypothetical protein